MTQGEKSYGSNGKQNALFPLEYMYITQGENGSYSHSGTYAIDFQGWGANGRIFNCQYYAPFDCKCVAIWGSTSPMIVWESLEPVNYIDGTFDYMHIGFVHDDNTPLFSVGDTRTQGQIIGHTGTYGNVTGDHVHIEVGNGHYNGYYQNSSGVYQLVNEYHIYNALGVNDTHIVHNLGYDWRIFENVRPYHRNGNFPWFIVNRKRRWRNDISS